MNKDQLISHIDDYLSPLGYKRKSMSWYKEYPEITTIFSIHRSRFGEIYYATLSWVFKEIAQNKRPKFYKVHSNLRAEDLNEHTDDYLDLEKEIDIHIREKKIMQLLKKSVDLLEEMSTVTDFKHALTRFNPRLFMLNHKAQDYLGITVE